MNASRSFADFAPHRYCKLSSPRQSWLLSGGSMPQRRMGVPWISSQTDVRTRWTELLDIEELLAQLSVTALKLPPGVERRDSLAEIARFRERITAMKRAEVDRAAQSRAWPDVTLHL